jgi:hypothetical protein
MPISKQIKVNIKDLVNCYEMESCHISDKAGFNIDPDKIEAVSLDGNTLTIQVTQSLEENDGPNEGA